MDFNIAGKESRTHDSGYQNVQRLVTRIRTSQVVARVNISVGRGYEAPFSSGFTVHSAFLLPIVTVKSLGPCKQRSADDSMRVSL